MYRITQLGLVNDENFICNSKLNGLLCGDAEIIKLPFKPKDGEPYWFWCNPIGGGGEVSKVYCRFGGDKHLLQWSEGFGWN